ncbi:unnamed protein product, partial [Prorocentrum cordatum]
TGRARLGGGELDGLPARRVPQAGGRVEEALEAGLARDGVPARPRRLQGGPRRQRGLGARGRGRPGPRGRRPGGAQDAVGPGGDPVPGLPPAAVGAGEAEDVPGPHQVAAEEQGAARGGGARRPRRGPAGPRGGAAPHPGGRQGRHPRG